MYSQVDEDEFIEQFFGREFVGNFVDVGAHDGSNVSNTRLLVERGWSGVLVEPSAVAFCALLDRYSNNKQLRLVHAAIGAYDGLEDFWDAPTLENAVFSTTEPSNREKWSHRTPWRGYAVATISWDRLRAWCSLEPVDFLSIDTEGTSIHLLNRLWQTPLRPDLICVEHDDHLDDGVLAAACRAGYKLRHKNVLNAFFSKKEDPR
jgi:FkbM family methyltransferase